jgi:hypothetical protein
MPYLRTAVAIAALRERLTALTLGAEHDDTRLFERVGVFGANRLVQAMRATFASEARVCFIVPGGDTYKETRDRDFVFSQRTTRFALLIADRALDTEKEAGVMGGPQNPGILEMKDVMIELLLAEPFAIPDLAFTPAEGEPLVIDEAGKNAGNIGRECWLQWLTCYAGSTRTAIP